MPAVMASMPAAISGVRFIAGWFIVKAGDALRIAERARVTPPPPANSAWQICSNKFESSRRAHFDFRFHETTTS